MFCSDCCPIHGKGCGLVEEECVCEGGRAGARRKKRLCFTPLEALALGCECDSSVLQPAGLASLLFINPSFGLSPDVSGTSNFYFYLCHLVTNVTDRRLFGYTKFNIPRKVLEKEFKTYD